MSDNNHREKHEIKMPKLPNLNQVLSDTIMQGEAVRKIREEAEQRRLERRRHRINLILGIVFGVAGLTIALLAWLYPR